MEITETTSVIEQVEAALDGRTQRWLSIAINFPENELSKMMTGKTPFPAEIIKKINNRLKIKIKI